MQFIIAMYLPLFYHSTLVLGLVISGLSYYVARNVMEEFHGVILQPHVWVNVDVTIMIYHVFESLVHRI